jgi:hypothetical protein
MYVESDVQIQIRISLKILEIKSPGPWYINLQV